MATEHDFKNTEKLLKKHNQSHLLEFWDQLSVSRQESLLGQIESRYDSHTLAELRNIELGISSSYRAGGYAGFD